MELTDKVDDKKKHTGPNPLGQFDWSKVILWPSSKSDLEDTYGIKTEVIKSNCVNQGVRIVYNKDSEKATCAVSDARAKQLISQGLYALVNVSVNIVIQYESYYGTPVKLVKEKPKNEQ